MTPLPNRVELIPGLQEWNESATLALDCSHPKPNRSYVVRYDPNELHAIRSVCARPAQWLGYIVARPETRRGWLGQPLPGRVPPRLARQFAARQALDRLRKLVG